MWSVCAAQIIYRKETPEDGCVEKELSARSFSFSPSYSSAGSEASCTVLTDPSYRPETPWGPATTLGRPIGGMLLQTNAGTNIKVPSHPFHLFAIISRQASLSSALLLQHPLFQFPYPRSPGSSLSFCRINHQPLCILYWRHAAVHCGVCSLLLGALATISLALRERLFALFLLSRSIFNLISTTQALKLSCGPFEHAWGVSTTATSAAVAMGALNFSKKIARHGLRCH